MLLIAQHVFHFVASVHRRVLFMPTQRADIGADAPADIDSDAFSNEGADNDAANAHAERPADARGARECNRECDREQRRASGLLQLVASLAMAALGRPARPPRLPVLVRKEDNYKRSRVLKRLHCCAAGVGVVGRGTLSHYRVL